MHQSARFRTFIACLAISASLPAQQYVFRAYRQAEGLKNLAINAMVMDHSGFLWLATQNGLYRFLGSGFERFGPEQGLGEFSVNALLVDPDGTVWVGTNEHLYRFSGQRFAPSPVSAHIKSWNHLAVEGERRMLVLDRGRLLRLERDPAGNILSNLPVFSAQLLASKPCLSHVTSVNVVVETASRSRVWIGCENQLASWTESPNAPPSNLAATDLNEWGTAKGLRADHWESVFLDSFGTLWAGGRSHIAALSQGSDRFQDRTIPGSDPGNTYPKGPFIEDRDRRLLVPCDDGIARWNGKNWQIFGPRNGLRLTGHVVSMVFDDAGDLWLATMGDGLSNWAGYEDFEGWSDLEKLPSAVIWSVLPTIDHRVLIGTDRGPGWIDPPTGASGRLDAAHRWRFGQVDSLGENVDGTAYAGTFSGSVLRLDLKSGRAQLTGRLRSFITRTVEGPDRHVYFTTDNGLFTRFTNNSLSTLRHVDAADQFLKEGSRIESGCKSPDGTVWFLANKRLLRLGTDGQWSQPPIDGFPRLPGKMLDMSCAPNGDIWITGQQTGTWRITPGQNRLQAWQLELPESYRMLTPVAILADSRGWVWLGTDEGLLAWNGRSWRHLTQESGLIWNDINQGTLASGADGTIWIGTSGGLAHLVHPDHIFSSMSLTATLTETGRGSVRFPSQQRITLPWSPLPMHLQVSSPAMRNRSELAFKYWMNGLQPDWMDAVDGKIVFSSLPPADYKFLARVENPGLSAFSNLITLEIRILPPWWQSWWFYSLCALAAVLFLLALAAFVLRHLHHRSLQLEMLVHRRTLELQVSREQLRVQATHDGLTALLNRGAVMRALEEELDRARRTGESLALVLADLDHFKRVNDTMGHLAGDEALRRFAAAVSASIRPYDHAGRYGGEEFLLILPQIALEAALPRLEALHASISNLKVPAGEASFDLTCSLGATLFNPADAPSTEECLLIVVDQALYEAKAAGRNRVVFKPVRTTQPQTLSAALPDSPSPGHPTTGQPIRAAAR